MPSRVPISFYLSILAGIVVLFNHYAASETGDVALNKVTGAAGRFYTVFRDTALSFQHGCSSHLEAALGGPTVSSFLPHDAVKHFMLSHRHESTQDSGRVSVSGTPSDRRHHGGYGGSNIAFVYHHSPVQSLEPRASGEALFGPSYSVLDLLKRHRLSDRVWERCCEALGAMAALLFRTCASWWWFGAPAKVTGVLLAAYVVLSTIGHLFGANTVLQSISQVYVVAVVDFLRCIEWEAQRRVLNIAVTMMEGAYDAVHVRERLEVCLVGPRCIL